MESVRRLMVVLFLLSHQLCPFIVQAQDPSGGYCFTVDGYSTGSHNFCERCENETRSGIGVFWTNKGLNTTNIYSTISDENLNRFDPRAVVVNVTSISIDGVELQGWFHIKLTMPTYEPTYAYTLQVEDIPTLRAVGELTTDLLSACEGGDLSKVPTAAQVIPCHGTPKTGVIVPNALVYSRDANMMDGTIRSETPVEIHVNWKIPYSYSCATARSFYIRIHQVTLPSSKNLKTYESQCSSPGPSCTVPTRHPATHVRILLPQLSVNGEFSYPHPLPPFYDSTKVNCHIPMKMDPPAPNTELKPFLQDEPNAGVSWVIPSPPCAQGQGNVFGGSFDPTLPKQPPRSLYLGRCTEDLEAEAGPTYTLPCTTLGGPRHDQPDHDYIATLPTMMTYIEGVRFDLCNCEVYFATDQKEGSLNLTSGGLRPIPPVTSTPVPDYPDILPPGNPGGVSGLSLSGNETNSSSTRQRETPVQYVLRKISRMYFIHGLFYSIAFLFLIPISIFSARYLKETFYNPEAVLDIWYRIHLVGIAGTFVCFMIGEFILLAGNYYATILEPTEASRSGSHGGIGASVIILFTALVITGGLRPFNPNSNVGLKCTIYFHGLLGFLFYYLGLITMILACLWNPGESAGMITIIVVWIVIDIVCHIIMTVFVMKKDRPSELATSGFPVEELVYEHRSAPGEAIRTKLFYIYIALGLIFTLTACIHSLPLITFSPNSTLNFNRTINMKMKADQNGSLNGDRVYY